MINPADLARHYSAFKVSERILLTGHSHQAWPDCALDGLKECWLDASTHVDEKWGAAFNKAQAVEQGFARIMQDTQGVYALAPSTHDLVIKFLSALPLRTRGHVVATDSEFHSLTRQLRRLEEEGLKVTWVAAHPARTVGERLVEAVNEQTAAVFCSAVFFNSGHRAGGLQELSRALTVKEVPLVIDVYHALNAVPFTVQGLESAYIIGGGYKYCQLGEGCCFLRAPKDTALRPVVTGWMADFSSLSGGAHQGPVGYGPGGQRFWGATYDPASHYRGSAVFEFFARQGLTPKVLRELNQHQIGVLEHGFDDLFPGAAEGGGKDVIWRDHSVPKAERGGFLALKSPHAQRIVSELHKRGVFTDSRGDTLRLGPAPYITDAQLEAALVELFKVVSAITPPKKKCT